MDSAKWKETGFVTPKLWGPTSVVKTGGYYAFMLHTLDAGYKQKVSSAKQEFPSPCKALVQLLRLPESPKLLFCRL